MSVPFLLRLDTRELLLQVTGTADGSAPALQSAGNDGALPLREVIDALERLEPSVRCLEWAGLGLGGMAHDPLASIRRTLDDDPDAVLRPGDVLDARTRVIASPLELWVVAGPEAGARHPLTVGTHRIGRASAHPAGSHPPTGPGRHDELDAALDDALDDVLDDVTPPIATDVALDDDGISAAHALLRVEADGTVHVRDLGSANGTTLDGVPIAAGDGAEHEVLLTIGAVLGMGRSAVQLTVPHTAAVRARPGRPTARGTRTFNRPPLPPTPVTAALRVPLVRRDERAPLRFGAASLLGPLVLAGAMALLFSPRMAVLGLASPLMLLANAAADRRRTAHAKRSGRADLDAELAAFRPALHAAWCEAVAARRAAHPPLPALEEIALGPGVALWARRPDHPDAYRAAVAWGAAAFRPALVAPGEVATEATEALQRYAWCDDVPVAVDFGPGARVGIAGGGDEARRMLLAAVLELCVHHGPADLAIALIAEEEALDHWAPLAALPHLRSGEEGAEPPVATCPAAAESLLADRRAATVAGHGNRNGEVPRTTPVHHLVIVDHRQVLTGRSPALRTLLADAGGAAVALLASATDELPAQCTTLVTCADGTVRCADLAPDRGTAHDAGHPVHDPRRGATRASAGTDLHGERPLLLPIAAQVVAARRLCAALSAWDDPEAREGRADLPVSVRLADVLPTGRTIGADDASGRGRRSRDGEPARHGSRALAATRAEHRARGPFDVAALRARWSEPAVCSQRSLVALLGAAEQGPFSIDLVADGPHALLAGTTGAGKSELLRTLVASLAAAHSPEHLAFVLVDYKGGSAFAECAQLPHTAGMVTDLDGALAERALLCLEAELRHRETVLAAHAAADLNAYAALRAAAGDQGAAELAPLPRLVVVIDEFATLAAELPDFMAALVGVAQRGRSLGVHLVLATQRPNGAVNDNIRANTNLRIALRVQDVHDSTDVIGSADAARLGRGLPGRAIARLGAGETVAFQTAIVSTAPPDDTDTALRVTQLDCRTLLTPPLPRAAVTDAPSDLARLSAACRAAAEVLGIAAPRRPWPDPLPAHLTLDELDRRTDASPTRVVLGRTDDPQRQCQPPFSIDVADGNVMCIGAAGSGTTSALLGLVHALCAASTPDRLHVYTIDYGSGTLRDLDALPHVGATIGAAERERQERLVRMLTDELAHRRDGTASGGAVPPTAASNAAGTALPDVLVVIDNFAGLRAAFDDAAGLTCMDRLQRLLADGAALGIRFAISADRPQAVPLTMAASFPQKLVLRLTDPFDYAQLGVRSAGAALTCPGRAVLAADGRVAQLAHVETHHLARLASATVAPRAAAAVRMLPEHVGAAALLAAAQAAAHTADTADTPAAGGSTRDGRETGLGGLATSGGVLMLPFAIGDERLAPVSLELGDADGALVAGPARSGKSSTLAMLGAAASAVRPDLTVLIGARGRSPLRRSPSPDSTEAFHAAARFDSADDLAAAILDAAERAPTLALVDDAELFDDPNGALQRLLTARHSGVWVIASGRAEVLRASYGHWTQILRRSRIGVLLRPQLDLDGDLLSTQLPRRAPRQGPGRGYLVADGRCELVQVGHAGPLATPSRAIRGRAA